MTKEEFALQLLEAVKASGLDPTASKIDGAPVIGVELEDGTEFFIAVQDA